ncbi:unnamed protein product [Urochloa humidicola]
MKSQHQTPATERGTEKQTKKAHSDTIVVHGEGGGIRTINRSQWPKLQLRGESESEKKTPSHEIDQSVITSQESIGLGEVDEHELDRITQPDGIQKLERVIAEENGARDEDMAEIGDEEGQWMQPHSNRKKIVKKRRLFPAVAARKSSRTKGLGGSAEKERLNNAEMAGFA